MKAIDTYTIRTTLIAFLMVLVSLTGIIWVTQALRGIDLMTGQGQSILVFLGVTGLAIPLLAMIIAPIALLIAVMHSLNRFATDSEIIVMNAAGLSPDAISSAVSGCDVCGERAGRLALDLYRTGMPARAEEVADGDRRGRPHQHSAAR